MLALERIRTELLSLPFLVRIGLAILVVGGLADVVAHLEAIDELAVMASPA